MALTLKVGLNTTLKYGSNIEGFPRNGNYLFKTEYLTSSTKLYANLTASIGTGTTAIDVTALTDPDGISFNLAHVHDIGIINDSTATITVCETGGSNPLLNQFTIAPGKAWQLGTLIATSGSVKNLNLKAGAANSAVRIYIAGTTT